MGATRTSAVRTSSGRGVDICPDAEQRRFVQGRPDDRRHDDPDLESAQRRFNALADIVPAGILRVNAEGTEIVEADERLRALYGLAPDAPVSSLDLGAVVHPDDQELVTQGWVDAVAAGRRYEQQYRIVMPDGQSRWIASMSVPERDANGTITGWVATLRDIDEARRALDALRESEERFRLLVENIRDYLIFMLDADGIVRTWNQGGEMVGRYGADDVIGQHVSSFYIEEARAEGQPEIGLKIAARDGRFEEERRTRRGDGSPAWAHISYAAIRDGKGVLRGYAGVVRDITERKEHEAELRRARQEAQEASAAKSEFLSRMSHELRTPLNAIIGFAQLLALDELTDEQRESIGHITAGGRRLLELIDEVLDISRIDSGGMPVACERVDAVEVAHESLNLVRPQARQRAIRLVADLDGETPLLVLADRRRLGQVLLNLLSNAVKYNVDGGSVTLGGARDADGHVALSVSDTGPGITPSDQERLFIPFERLGAEYTTVPGTGLGLPLSRRLVDAMGGQLTVRSTLGEGSTFTVRLPAAEPETRPHPRPGLSGPRGESGRAGATGTLLYVEDDAVNRMLVEAIVGRRPGVTLLAAMSGGEGLELARDRHPDLVLLDVQLPDLHGGEVLRRLRADPATADIPVVMASADAMPDQIETLLNAGADDYLTKPIEVAAFLALLDRMMSGDAA